MTVDEHDEHDEHDDHDDAGTPPPAGDDDHDDAGTPPAGDEDDHDDEADEDDHDEADEDDEDPAAGASFDAAYVRRLRRRSAGYRTEARESAEALEAVRRELFTARVEALAILSDPDDLPYDAALLEDGEALEAAARDLVARKPHYGRRGRLRDTGARDTPDAPMGGLLDLMRDA